MGAGADRATWPVVPGYELHAVLGRGPSATVFRATQRSVDRPVAVKVLTATVDPGTGRRVRQRVRAVGVLAGHPHVVEVVDAGTTTDGSPFVAMELVTAGSFGDRVRAFGPMTATEAARVGAEVADALEAAHGAGLVHGRVTADNVLVGRRGRSLLADFAIVLDGEPPTAADDVRDLGATLGTLAADRSSPALDQVIGACLASDPARRPSVADLATALEAIAAGRTDER